MQFYTLGLMLLLSASLVGCANFTQTQQNFSILKRNTLIAATVIESHRQMVETGQPVAILKYQPDETDDTQSFLGRDRLSIVDRESLELAKSDEKSVCLTFYRYDIPAKPVAEPCFELLALADKFRAIDSRFGRVERRIASNENRIRIVERAIDKNTTAILETLRSNATNTNTLVAQNEFFDSVKAQAEQMKITLDSFSSQNGNFQRRVTSDLAQLGIKLQQLINRLDAL